MRGHGTNGLRQGDRLRIDGQTHRVDLIDTETGQPGWADVFTSRPFDEAQCTQRHLLPLIYVMGPGAWECITTGGHTYSLPNS